MAKYGKAAGKAVKSAMRRRKRGTLRSGKSGIEALLLGSVADRWRFKADQFRAQKKGLGYCHATNILAGEYYESAGRLQRAEAEYREALRLRPDFAEAGGETQAKRAGKQRLETKQYVMQDYDLVNFRFNK